MQKPRQLLIVGHPTSRRVRSVVESAQRRDWSVRVISYPELIRQRSIGCFVAPGTIVRFESPSECDETLKQILIAGIPEIIEQRRVPLSESQILDMEIGRGEMLNLRQWYYGFSQLLRQWQHEGNAIGCRWMNSPQAIIAAFDKEEATNRFAAAGLPVPQRFQSPRTYSELREVINLPHQRLFIKLKYGYSAMGAMALEWRKDRVRAITTAEVTWALGRPRLFVSKKTRVIHKEHEIAWLFDTLAMEGIVIEQWLPKARIGGRPFDIRIVTVDGIAQHITGRSHTSPFTNLNLDASRIPFGVLADDFGDHWADVKRLAEQTAMQFPQALYLGVDLLPRPNRSCVVLEVNAFGDYLPKLKHNGLTTYEAELQAMEIQMQEAT